jgi:hypothetical protein
LHWESLLLALGFILGQFGDLGVDLLRDNLDENGASIWMRRSGRAGR